MIINKSNPSQQIMTELKTVQLISHYI